MNKYFLLLFFSTSFLYAQINDSLVRYGKAPYILIINGNISEKDNFGVKYYFEQAGNKFVFNNRRSADFNKKYAALSLSSEFIPSLPSIRYYKIEFENNTVYVGNNQLKKFIEKFHDNEHIYLTKYFTTNAYIKYMHKKNNENIEDYYDCCPNVLSINKEIKFKTSKSLANILLKKPIKGKVKIIYRNSIQVVTEENQFQNFMQDVDYYIEGKPNLRIRITYPPRDENISAEIYDISDNARKVFTEVNNAVVKTINNDKD